jgi:uncharacterized protein (TIGR02145 family)
VIHRIKRNIVFFLLLVLVYLFSCERPEIVRIIKIETLPVTNYTSTMALLPGNIIDTGKGIIECGHFWGLSPTYTNFKTSLNNIRSGSFSSALTGLHPSTTYYIRAYANDGEDVVSGEVISFTTWGIAPVAAFTATPTTITAGQSVQFTDQSTNTPTDWIWDFGDGNTSTLQNPSHAYSTVGTYSIILTTTNTFGSDDETKTNYIAVNNEGEAGYFTDGRDEHIYNWITIGDQVWMAENLAYLPAINPPSNGSYAEPYYYVYGYSGISDSAAKLTTNYAAYGVLYNWMAAMNGAEGSSSNPSGIQGVCPEGWHMPSYEEWSELTGFLGGDNVAGGKLKETGYTHWNSPNTGATNKSGFRALPGGNRYHNGDFDQVGNFGLWWSTNDVSELTAWGPDMGHDYTQVVRNKRCKDCGYSIRCVRDN